MSAPEKIALASLSRDALEALTERLLAENAALAPDHPLCRLIPLFTNPPTLYLTHHAA